MYTNYDNTTSNYFLIPTEKFMELLMNNLLMFSRGPITILAVPRPNKMDFNNYHTYLSIFTTR